MVFYCDKCNMRIKNLEEGYLEWLTDGEGNYSPKSLRIVHHGFPLGEHGARCQYEGNKIYQLRKLIVNDMNLDFYSNGDGLGQLLDLIVINKILAEEVCEIIRRIHVPRYEADRHEYLSLLDRYHHIKHI